METYSRPMNLQMLKCCDEECSDEHIDIDIEPDDIDVSDMVTVVGAIN